MVHRADGPDPSPGCHPTPGPARARLKPAFQVEDAIEADVAAIATLRAAVAVRLTRDYGQGHWSAIASEQSVLRGFKHARVLVVRDGTEIIGTLRLQTKKPWAIDPAYFHVVRRPLYLTDMAVAPDRQRRGVGRRLLEEAKAVARAWPADALRLDAYDADAGAGAFYAKWGFREVGRVSYRGTPLVYFELLL